MKKLDQMRFSKRRKKNESGQTTVEFALTLVFAMSVVFFYIQLSLVLAFSNYVQYATFMAARAYYAGSASHGDQIKRAENVIKRMLKRGVDAPGADRFPSIAKGTGDGDLKGAKIGPHDKFSPTTRDYSWLEGVRYTFRSRIFMIPMGGSQKSDKVNSVTLTSESWLGREPSVDDCAGYMSTFPAIIDNGC